MRSRPRLRPVQRSRVLTLLRRLLSGEALTPEEQAWFDEHAPAYEQCGLAPDGDVYQSRSEP